MLIGSRVVVTSVNRWYKFRTKRFLPASANDTGSFAEFGLFKWLLLDADLVQLVGSFDVVFPLQYLTAQLLSEAVEQDLVVWQIENPSTEVVRELFENSLGQPIKSELEDSSSQATVEDGSLLRWTVDEDSVAAGNIHELTYSELQNHPERDVVQSAFITSNLDDVMLSSLTSGEPW